MIRALGKKADVPLDPATPPELVEYVLRVCDVILVMTVNLGFGGQRFLAEMLPKIRRLRAMGAERGLPRSQSMAARPRRRQRRRRPPAQQRLSPARRFSGPRITLRLADIRTRAAAAAVTS
jgi:hypothetical protein